MASAGSGVEQRMSRRGGGMTPPPSAGIPAIGVLVVALALVVGCALGRPVVAPPDPASVATDGAGGQIELSAFGDPEEAAVFRAIIDGYGRANGQVSVRLNVVPNQNEFMTRLSAAFAAGKPPDVFLVNYRRYAQFAARNALEPLGPYLGRSSTLKAEQFFEMPMKAFTWNGQLQCIPQNQSSLVVYYNRDLFAKYNVPPPAAGWAWSDFLNAARGLTIDEDGDGEAEVHGLVAEPTIIRAAPFIWQRGGRLVDDRSEEHTS